MLAKLSKSCIRRAGHTIKYSIAVPIITICSYASIGQQDQQELSAIKNKLVYVDWAATAANKIAGAKDGVFYKEKPRKVSKYRESIINVIGHAIADCVTMQKEFAEKENGRPRVITFEANPLGFARRHWNAAIIYELVDYIIHNERLHEGIALSSGGSETIRKEVWDAIKEDLTQAYADKNVPDLEYKLERSIEDIKQYDKELKLTQIRSYKINEEYLQLTNTSIKHKVLKHKLINEDSREDSRAIDLNHIVYIKGDDGGQYIDDCPIQCDIKLSYNPKALEGEKWRLVNDASGMSIRKKMKVQCLHGIKDNILEYSGGFETCSRVLDEYIVKYFIQFIECDLELDAAELRDYLYYKKSLCNGNAVKYYGKVVKIWPKDPNKECRTVAYGQNCEDDSNFWKDNYRSYKLLDPKERPRPVDD